MKQREFTVKLFETLGSECRSWRCVRQAEIEVRTESSAGPFRAPWVGAAGARAGEKQDELAKWTLWAPQLRVFGPREGRVNILTQPQADGDTRHKRCEERAP